MQVIRGKILSAKKVVVYGPEGIGKSTFASRFPDPLFIDTEGSTKDLDVARTPTPSSWSMLMEQVRTVKRELGICKTLIIDTADWAEMLCINQILDNNHKKSIEEFGYGKGYIYVQEEFGRLLNLLDEVIDVGITVVLNAHAKMRKFEQPDEMGAYDRWEMKLSKGVAPMVKEWADMVLFANYKTVVLNVDGQGAQKGKNKAQGGKRVLYTSHHPCWDAKNRYSLPDEIPFEYAAIAKIIEEHQSEKSKPAETKQQSVEVAQSKRMEPVSELPKVSIPDGTQEAPLNPPEDSRNVKYTKGLEGKVPKALLDLMEANQVTSWDVEAAVSKKGYMPEGMPITDYPEDFVMGCLVAAWPKVYELIKQINFGQEIPFED